MAVISLEEALRILGPVTGHLRECHLEAWAIYREHFNALMPLATVGGKAATIHELVIERIRHHAADMPTVRIRENVCGGRFILEVGNQLIVHFKKLTKDFHTTNNPTQNSEAFDLQEEIDGFPSWPRLCAGYAFGELGTSMEGPYLACLTGKQCEWYYDLGSGEGTGVLAFPAPHTLPPDRDAAPRPEVTESESGND